MSGSTGTVWLRGAFWTFVVRAGGCAPTTVTATAIAEIKLINRSRVGKVIRHSYCRRSRLSWERLIARTDVWRFVGRTLPDADASGRLKRASAELYPAKYPL